MRKFVTKKITRVVFVLFCFVMLFVNAQVNTHWSIPHIQVGKKPTAKSESQKVKATANKISQNYKAPLPPPANVLVNNNVGATTTGYFTQSGSSTLAFGSNIVVAFNDAGSNAGGTNKFTGYAYSTDGGVTFTDGGTLPTNGLGDAGDPCLARNNATGRIYLSALSFSSPYTVGVFRSDDNGVTWMTPVIGAPGGASENKPRIAVDNSAGAGNGNVYLMSRRYSGAPGMYFFRSVDHGTSFGPAGGILLTSAVSEGAFVVVGPDHAVYAFWYEPGSIKMRKSTDLGLTFGAAVTVVSGLLGGPNGDLGLTGVRQGGAIGPFRTNEFPQVAVNPVTGHIYVSYANDGVGADKADVFLKTSTDGGLTWSAALKVNDDVTATDQWQPTVAVTPDGLHLGVFYYSRQNDPANNLFQYYSRVADISGSTLTFGFSAAVSTVASFPEFGRDVIVNSTYVGDYHQTAATTDGFNVTWSDNRNDLAGGLPRKDPNVYFSKIPVTGIPPVSNLNFSSASLSGGNGNGLIDFGETVNITVALTNAGGATATGITSTLSTTTPGINITQANSAYTDINSLASGNNTTAFTITTTAAYTCSPALFSLTVNYSDGPETFNFIIPSSGVAGTPLVISNNTVTPIADLSTTDIPFIVSGFTGEVTNVVVSFHLTHTFDGDLRLSLISPDGTSVALSTGRGGSGDNYGTSCATRTVFDDAAATSITTGTAPFAGTFRPEIQLSNFVGKTGAGVNGTWKLRIIDIASLDVGTFQCATLTLTPSACPGADLQLSSPIVLSGGNGNGTIESGETVNITIPLINAGAATATGITSTLSTNTPGINITQGSSAYADINVASSGNNTTAFTITTNSDYTCSGGSFALTVNYNNGPETFNFTLPGSGLAGSPVNFSYNTPTPIADLNTTEIPITVSGFSGVIANINLSLHLTHTYVSDLKLSLIGPDGTTVLLSNKRGGSGDNYGSSCSGRTVFDDAAATSITTGAAPFVGTFKPEGTLSTFIGKSGADVNGTWKVRIVDSVNLDVGTFQCATLTLTPFTCPTAGNADLQITKLGSPIINPNANLIYTITVVNNGPVPATNVVLNDVLPANTSFVSVNTPPGWNVISPPVGSGGTVTAQISALAPGAPVIFTLTVNVGAVTSGTVISNIAVVTGGEDVNPANNSAIATGIVESPCLLICPADITVTTTPGQCGAIVNFAVPTGTGACGAIIATPASGSLFPFGTTPVTVSSSTGASCSFNITVNPSTTTDCAITGRTSICEVESVQWCGPDGMTNYEWDGPNQFKVFTKCATIQTPGLYTVAYTDANGCRKVCSQELQVTTCPVACTYTQGFYGNKKGMACYMSNGSNSNISTTQLMLNAFGASTSRVFGNVANKQFFTLYKADISNGNIFKMLPGMGASSALGVDLINPLDGAYYSNDNTWYLVPIPKTGSQKGRINNMLLSQLMTLWFNTQTSATLGTISLSEDTLVTQAQTSCGSGIPTGAMQKFGLPHEVVEYLNDGNGYSADVNGLFLLANDVLGGINNSVSATDVQNAVAAINNAFDGCRVLTETLPYVPMLLARGQNPVKEMVIPKFSMRAFPNPTSTFFNVQVSSSISDRIIITVSDALGRKIETRTMVPNETVQIGQKYRPGVYIVRVVQGKESREIKLMKLSD